MNPPEQAMYRESAFEEVNLVRKVDLLTHQDGCIIDCLRNIYEKSVLQNVWVKNKSGSCWNSKGKIAKLN